MKLDVQTDLFILSTKEIEQWIRNRDNIVMVDENDERDSPGFFAEIIKWMNCGVSMSTQVRDNTGDSTDFGAKDRQGRLSALRLSTSPTARSRKESPTPNGRSISPTALARPSLSYGDSKLKRLEASLDDQPPQTLFKAEWKSFGPFGCLADHTMNECINLMQVHCFSKGETIIRRGSSGTSLFFMDIGCARVSIKEHEYADIKSGEYFGEIAFVAMCKKLLDDNDNSSDDTPEKAIRLADVTAGTACRILTLEARNFVDLLKKHPECKQKLIRSLNLTAEENKAHVQEVNDHYFRKEDLNLIKARSERHRENIYDIQYGHP